MRWVKAAHSSIRNHWTVIAFHMQSTTITTMSGNALDTELIDRWNKLQASNPTLDSPLFSAGFMRAAAQERHGIEVAVIESAGSVIGFLPYCRQHNNVAMPVAGSFTDFQGVISAPGTSIDIRKVLRSCRLAAWQFDHLVVGDESLEPFQWAFAESPYMDLSQGFDAFRDSCRNRGGKEMAEVLRKERKLEREVAPIRMEIESTNCHVFDTLIDWKRQQLGRQKRSDCFRPEWVLPFLNRILHTHGETLRPVLSAMYVGEKLAAINFGLRNGPVLHGWITAFNPEFHKFSPGLMLIVKLARQAEELGIERIDMGRGDESFKRNFSSGVTQVAEGAVDRRLVVGAMQHGWVRGKELLRGTPLSRPAQQLIRRLRHASGAFRHSLDSGR